MIKGHVCIDLHNTKSGFTERIEKDNMVTNAVAKILPMQMGKRANDLYSYDTDTLNRYVFPIAMRLLGGIMLFDGELTEDPDHFSFPSEAHLVGFAGRTTDTSHAFMGSLNVLESGPTDLGYTGVWDFSTSQCNNRIEALALTHENIANGLFAGCGLRGFTWEFDEPNQIQYYLSNNLIRKRRYVNYRFKLCDTLWETKNDVVVKDILDDDPDFKEVYEKYFNKNVWAPQYDSTGYYYHYIGFQELAAYYYGYDGYLYMVYQKEITYRLKTFYVLKWRVDDFSFDFMGKTELQIEATNLTTTKSKLCISHGYFYAINYDNAREVYRINLDNPEDQVKYVLEKVAYRINALPNGGVKVHYDSNGFNDQYPYGILYPDRRIVDFRDKGTLPFSPWGAGGYLGTICNLSGPITKTASQTMKITYTLTDVEE